MRKVVYYLASSLDGFIARKDGSVDWLKMEDLEEAGEEFNEFTASVDTVLYGRKTFEKGLELDTGGNSFKGFTNYVFSRSLQNEDPPFATFVNEEAGEFVRNLRKSDGKNIWLMGGGEFAASLLDEGLIDEIVINIQPVLLGEGIPVFVNSHERLDLTTTDVKHRKSGSIQASYRLEKVE